MTHPVYLVRHGQSEWNLRRLTQGQIAHPHLTELGRVQAASAADLIARDVDARGLSVRRVVTSDLVRARETAEVLAARLGLGGELVLDTRLREQHLGSLEGCSYEETWAAAARIDWSDPTVPIAGGESLMDVYERMAAVIDEITSDAVSVLVSHGDSIRALLAYLRGVQPHQSTWVDVPNGAVVRWAGQFSWLASGTAPASVSALR